MHKFSLSIRARNPISARGLSPRNSEQRRDNAVLCASRYHREIFSFFFFFSEKRRGETRAGRRIAVSRRFKREIQRVLQHNRLGIPLKFFWSNATSSAPRRGKSKTKGRKLLFIISELLSPSARPTDSPRFRSRRSRFPDKLQLAPSHSRPRTR